jgi:putative N6-adenine-specific DNA methylase
LGRPGGTMKLQLFLPCAAGVEDFLQPEVQRITGLGPDDVQKRRGGVMATASWRDALLLNLHSRLAQRVLVQLSHTQYRSEQDLYRAASEVAWEIWFTPRQSIKVEVTAQHSPLTSLNFAALKIKDAVCDRFRAKAHGVRPDVNTQWPDIRIYAHLTTDSLSLYIDTSGEPLFKRGWREDKGDAPLKETLAAAMIAASGWADHAATGDPATASDPAPPPLPALYDPCCGSGTIAIEAAQIACNIAPGILRNFAFEKMLPFQDHVWNAIKLIANNSIRTREISIFGSDVAHRMVDFAERNAERAGVADVIEFRGGDALQRMPPGDTPGVMLLNPPYGERIAVAGIAKGSPADAGFEDGEPQGRFGARELAHTEDGGEFFSQLATHWKKNYPGWTAWVLTPDLKLPSKMRLKESRRVPMWNGPIECRLFKFDMVKGSARDAKTDVQKMTVDGKPPRQ